LRARTMRSGSRYASTEPYCSRQWRRQRSAFLRFLRASVPSWKFGWYGEMSEPATFAMPP